MREYFSADTSGISFHRTGILNPQPAEYIIISGKHLLITFFRSPLHQHQNYRRLSSRIRGSASRQSAGTHFIAEFRLDLIKVAGN